MAQSTPPPAAVRKLPVGATVLETYGRVFSHLRLVFRAAAFPFALSFVIALLSLPLQAGGLLGFLVFALAFVPYTLFGVAWHRVTLLGPAAGTPPLIPAWQRRHWRFLGYCIALLAIAYGIFLVLSVVVAVIATGVDAAGSLDESAAIGVGLAIAVLGVLAVFAVVVRFTFVFPAAAVDEAYRLKHSWTHTRGQGLRLLATLVVVSLPMAVLIWMVASLLGAALFTDFGPPADGATPGVPAMQDYVAENLFSILIWQVVLAILNYVLMALLVSAISIAFRTCTGWVPDAGNVPGETDENR